ncbi:MAG: class I SAM-dependent methyltransferase [Verrucomicrobia bacterium]|nr:class I SAM-dependent methyltransferase [Verrucomicrobiota bacterium]MBV8640301.1 class I SAM-dependent methyltransferase [Verrucomicrobiota bacterium]
MNKWTDTDHVTEYLSRADRIPHRKEGEQVLMEHLPDTVSRVLDIGTGDGRLLSMILACRSNAEGVGLDFSPAMLEQARSQFAGNKNVQIVEANLDEYLPKLGTFDAIVSSFAIHHCSHERKRSIYEEVYEMLNPGGIFCNLEHVASPTYRLHERFMKGIGGNVENEDPTNKLLDLQTQLEWLRAIGFEDVDCYWKWLELALIIGYRPQ